MPTADRLRKLKAIAAEGDTTLPKISDTPRRETLRQVASEVGSLAAGQPAKPQKSQVAFPFRTDDTIPYFGVTDVGLRNTARMIGNIPGDLGKLAPVLQRPDLAISGAAQVIAGSGEELFRRIGLLDDTPRAQAFRMVAADMVDRAKNPGRTLVEEPVSAFLDILGLVSGGATASGRLLKAGQVARQAIGQTGKNMIKKIDKTMQEVAAARSGLGTAGAEIIREAGKVGGAKREAFVTAREAGEAALPDVARKVQVAIDAAEDMKALRFSDSSAKLELKNINNPISPRAVYEKSINDLSEFGGRLPDGSPRIKFRPRRHPHTGQFTGDVDIDFSKSVLRRSDSQMTTVQSAFDEVTEWMREGDNSIDTAHVLQQVLDTLIDKSINKANNARSNAMLVKMRQNIRAELGSKVAGFDEMQGAYASASEFIQKVRKALGIKRTDNPLEAIGLIEPEAVQAIDELLMTKLGNLLNDRTSKNLQLRKSFVQELDRILEAKTGQPGTLFEDLAGIRASGEAARGIVRATGASGTVGGMVGAGAGFQIAGPIGATVGAGAGSSLSILISNLLIRNPRTVSTFLLSLGATERRAAKVGKLFEMVKNNTPANRVAAGITFGVALEAMRKRSADKAKVNGMLKKAGIPQ